MSLDNNTLKITEVITNLAISDGNNTVANLVIQNDVLNILEIGIPGLSGQTYSLTADSVIFDGSVELIAGNGINLDANVGDNTIEISSDVNISDYVLKSELTYIHTQIASSSTWVINHGLHRYPSVTIVDSGGTRVVGETIYNSIDQITVNFSAAFSGEAYLN